MRIVGDCIHFESTEVNYNKEKQVDVKQNTVRRISQEDKQWYQLNLVDDADKGHLYSGKTEITKICIHHMLDRFTRELTDVTYWDERYIFSWKCSC